MTYDDTVRLIDVRTVYDDVGDSVDSETATEVFCNVDGVGYRHYYAARDSGLKPEHTITLHSFEYSNEKLVELYGRRYVVDRVYPVGIDEVELTVLTAKGEMRAVDSSSEGDE